MLNGMVINVEEPGDLVNVTFMWNFSLKQNCVPLSKAAFKGVFDWDVRMVLFYINGIKVWHLLKWDYHWETSGVIIGLFRTNWRKVVPGR